MFLQVTGNPLRTLESPNTQEAKKTQVLRAPAFSKVRLAVLQPLLRGWVCFSVGK